MTTAGVLFMVLSWAVIIGLNVFCFSRLTGSESESAEKPNE